MTEKTIYLNRPEIINQLERASLLVRDNKNSAEHKEIYQYLSVVLSIMAQNAVNFDANCQFTLRTHSKQFANLLFSVKIDDDRKSLQKLISLTYRILVEFDLSMESDLSDDLTSFQNAVEESATSFDPEIWASINFAKTKLPYRILKSVFNSPDFVTLRKVVPTAARIDQDIQAWERRLSESEEKVESLNDSLGTC